MTGVLTPSQTCGPLFGFAILPAGIHATIDEKDPAAVTIVGDLLDGAGKHLGYEAFLEFWSEGQACRVRTIEGRFRAVLRRPEAFAGADGARWAPCLSIAIHARGITRHLVTRLYFPEESEANAADPVLACVDEDRRATLIARPLDLPGRYAFDIRLQGEGETVFFELAANPR